MTAMIKYDIVHGDPCAFTRDEATGSHPATQTLPIRERLITFCRHCMRELDNQPLGTQVEEPQTKGPVINE